MHRTIKTNSKKIETFLKPCCLLLLIIALQLKPFSTNAQVADSIVQTTASVENKAPAKPVFKSPGAANIVIPAAMISYGLLALETPSLRQFNQNIKKEIYSSRPHQKTSVDNYLQFAPAVAVFGLNAVGVKSRNNFFDRSMIFGMSNIILNAIVYPSKMVFKQLRPDSSDHRSFPSGHTAEAFANAEFMRREYQGISGWYGLAGYGMAIATGYLRMYNNKHWLSDVAAGAGIGILSTKMSYWLYPKMKRLVFKDRDPKIVCIPSYSNHTWGLSFTRFFE